MAPLIFILKWLLQMDIYYQLDLKYNWLETKKEIMDFLIEIEQCYKGVLQQNEFLPLRGPWWIQ